ncbi:MAG: hypothetical protein QNJ68_03555 [Microcoleaceae cyanobacterium MO_207.B10]|nr:hypothetical protein [Microcoleaceae cyanobacterium MO_207.B10]
MFIDSLTLSSSLTDGEGISLEWAKSMGSPLVEWLRNPVASIKNLTSRILEGGKEVFRSFFNGTFGRIFGEWAKNDPITAGVAVIGAGLAIGALLIVGGTIIGWVVGIVAALGATFFGLNLLTGGAVGRLAEKLFDTAEEIYEFDWNVSDKELQQQINSLIDGLYGPAGEFLGGQLASFLFGRETQQPPVVINIGMLGDLWRIHPGIRQQMLQEVSNFAYLGMQTFMQMAIKYVFLQGRRAVKKLWKNVPEATKKAFPKLDKAISTWGDDGREPWSIQEAVDKKVESINNDKIEAFVKGFGGGFWGGARRTIEFRLEGA